MAHVVLVGRSQDLLDVARTLIECGHQVSLQARAEGEAPGLPARHGPESTAGRSGINAASAAAVFLSIAPQAHAQPAQALPALQPAAGGQAAAEEQPFHSLPAPRHGQRRRSAGPVRRQVYLAGERVPAQEGWVTEVEEGAVVLYVAHTDGSEALIGFLGPGDFLLPHPPDSCRVEAVAQTDVAVAVSEWKQQAGNQAFTAAVSSRVLRSEAWAASLAHPYIERRVAGILDLLAEQFGLPHEGGRLVDIRITHSQIAAITGATRPTITRTMAALAREGRVSTVGSGGARRLCVFPESKRSTR